MFAPKSSRQQSLQQINDSAPQLDPPPAAIAPAPMVVDPVQEFRPSNTIIDNHDHSDAISSSDEEILLVCTYIVLYYTHIHRQLWADSISAKPFTDHLISFIFL